MSLRALLLSVFFGLNLFAADNVPMQTYSVGSALPFTGILHFKYTQRGHKLYLTNGAVALASCGVALGASVLTIHFVSPLRAADYYVDPKIDFYKSETSVSKRFSSSQACQAGMLYLTSQPQASFSLNSNGELNIGPVSSN